MVRVVFDPKVISYDDLLRVFWENHDPTQGMRQGNDVGTQYRSAIYTYGDAQQKAAEASRVAYQHVLADARLRCDHDGDPARAGVLLRRGLPPAVPGEEPRRLLRHRRDRRVLPGRRRAGTLVLDLYLIRHGQTDFSRENRFCGSIDPPLNDVGLRMADCFGTAYADRSWDAIYVSPLQRARQTAAALARRVDVEPIVDDGLREISYGEWEGLRHEEAKERYPEAYAYWAADTASRSVPGGETAFQVAARAALVLERVKRDHADGRVFLVSHKATIRIVVCALLGLDVRLFRERIAQAVAAVTRFEITKKGALLTRLGDDEHLPADLRRVEGT